MYHLPTYFLQYPSNISILMLLSLRCLRHSEWRERFDTTTPPRLINNHRPPSCVRCTEYFYCRTIDFSFIFSRGLLCKFSKKKCLARNFPIEIQCILKQVARTPSPQARVAKTCRPCRLVGAIFFWPVLIFGKNC